MKQVDAVYAATHSVLKEKGINFEDGMNVADVMTDSIRQTVILMLCEGFQAGKIDFASSESNRMKLANPNLLKSYVNGLVNNWYRKDPRFNGNTKYEAKNPGSRQGSGDEQLKALKALKTKLLAEGEADNAAVVDGYIAKRIAELEAAKIKVVNMDAIPEELKKALGY
jgi:hypothetical protein